MKFLEFLTKSNKNVDEALDKCNQSYNEFKENAHKGHFQNFKDFKVKFNQESHYLRREIVDCKDNKLKMLLIEHMQKQLDYFNENHYGPYAAKIDLDNFNKFIAKNYPYKEKVDQIKTEYFLSLNRDEKFVKTGFSKLMDIIDTTHEMSTPFNTNHKTNSKPRIK